MRPVPRGQPIDRRPKHRNYGLAMHYRRNEEKIGHDPPRCARPARALQRLPELNNGSARCGSDKQAYCNMTGGHTPATLSHEMRINGQPISYTEVFRNGNMPPHPGNKCRHSTHPTQSNPHFPNHTHPARTTQPVRPVHPTTTPTHHPYHHPPRSPPRR